MEISYEEFIANNDQYFSLITSGKHVEVNKDGQRVTLLMSVDFSILSSALGIAQLIVDRSEE